jgi:hypothetical protein
MPCAFILGNLTVGGSAVMCPTCFSVIFVFDYMQAAFDRLETAFIGNFLYPLVYMPT